MCARNDFPLYYHRQIELSRALATRPENEGEREREKERERYPRRAAVSPGNILISALHYSAVHAAAEKRRAQPRPSDKR